MLERPCAGPRRAGNEHDELDQSTRALSRCAERRALHPPGIRLRSDLGSHRRGPRLPGRNAGRLGRLADRARRARRGRAHAHRVCRAGLPRQPRLPFAAAGRCRPRLRQRAERQAHGRGAGDRGRRRPHHRGHAAADALRRDRDQAHSDRGGRRQDACRARRPAGPASRDRRPHQRARDHRRRGHHRAAQGLRGRRRRHAVHGRRQVARRARRSRRGGEAAAVPRQRRQGALRPRLSLRPQRARLPAGSHADHGGDQCRARHLEGAARGQAGMGAREHLAAVGAHEACHAPEPTTRPGPGTFSKPKDERSFSGRIEQN